MKSINNKNKTKKKKTLPFVIKSNDISSAAKEAAQKVFSEKNKISNEKEVKFAGQKIKIKTNEPIQNKKEDSLDLLINSLKNPKNISTLDKTAYDWEQYKDKTGIKEDVENAAKHGYLEKKDFLLRVDYRQFEKEREQREEERIKRELALSKSK